MAPANAGLFRDSGGGWEWVTGHRDANGRGFEGDTRHLGSFAIFRDLSAPSIARLAPPRRAAREPNSRWALEARLQDHGSGVDAHGSYFVVDGRRRPAEWDDEEGVLRWRPLAPPARGRHRFVVVAADRAGNERKASGSFVLD